MELRDLKIVAMTLFSLIAGWWAQLETAVQVLVVLMALDILTGMVAAFVGRRAASTVALRGIAKKVLVLLLVAAARAVEPVIGFDASSYVAMFFVAYEALSILENGAKAGVPIPERLRSALVALKGDGDADRPQGQ